MLENDVCERIGAFPVTGADAGAEPAADGVAAVADADADVSVAWLEADDVNVGVDCGAGMGGVLG